MTGRLLVVGSVVAIGCGTQIEGRWTGECEIVSDGQAVTWDLELDIASDKGGEIEGEGELSSFGYKYDGDLEGRRDGTDVELAFEVEQAGYNFEIELEGTSDDDRMSGDCEIRGSGVNYLVQGDFELALD